MTDRDDSSEQEFVTGQRQKKKDEVQKIEQEKKQTTEAKRKSTEGD